MRYCRMTVQINSYDHPFTALGRPRSSPLWQIIHHGWDDFQAQYEASYRKAHGPLRSDAIEVVEKFYRCGDLAQGFTRLHCKDCGHEKLLAFTCKTRGYCPSCHQRRSLETADWIAKDITFNVPHRMYVFTIPRVLRAIFRKRRKLLTHLFLQSIEALKLWMQTSLGTTSWTNRRHCRRPHLW